MHRHKMVIMSCAADEGVFSAQASHLSSAVHTAADVTDTVLPHDSSHAERHNSFLLPLVIKYEFIRNPTLPSEESGGSSSGGKLLNHGFL